MPQVKIDSKALRNWVKGSGMTAVQICDSIGRNNNFFSDAYRRETMNSKANAFLCKTYGLPTDSFLIKEPSVEEVKAKEDDKIGYHVDLDVRPDRLKFTLSFRDKEGDTEIAHAFSKIKSNTELDLVQAVSYAAHMVYKIVEQKTLGE